MLMPSFASSVVICDSTAGMFLCARQMRAPPLFGTVTVGKLTLFVILPFSRKSTSSFAAMTAQLSSDSAVDAPRCGIEMTRSVPISSGVGKSTT